MHTGKAGDDNNHRSGDATVAISLEYAPESNY